MVELCENGILRLPPVFASRKFDTEQIHVSALIANQDPPIWIAYGSETKVSNRRSVAPTVSMQVIAFAAIPATLRYVWIHGLIVVGDEMRHSCQLVKHVASALKSVVGGSDNHSIEEPIDVFHRGTAPQFDEIKSVVSMPLASENLPAAQESVQYLTQRIHVGGLCHLLRFAVFELRRHVDTWANGFFGDSEANAVIDVTDSKVAHHRRTCGTAKEYVCRLQVAMDNSGFVRRSDTFTYLPE